MYLYGGLNVVDMILSQEEREYIQLFKDMIVVLYADSDIEPLLTFCNQCITKEAEIFSSMSRHLEMMRKKNNDIQNAQYLKNVINGVIAMLGNENVILYDNIEQLDVQFRKQIKITEGGNLAASKIRNLECPNYEICLIDYGCGKFNRKIHIMEQYP